MYVAYCSKKEFNKLKPDPRVIAITLDEDITKPQVLEDTQWARHLVIPFKSISAKGSFTNIDAQATVTGEYIRENIITDMDVVVHCQQGEYRSPAVAMAVALAFGYNMKMIRNGVVVDSDDSYISDVFTGRSAGIILDILSMT